MWHYSICIPPIGLRFQNVLSCLGSLLFFLLLGLHTAQSAGTTGGGSPASRSARAVFSPEPQGPAKLVGSRFTGGGFGDGGGGGCGGAAGAPGIDTANDVQDSATGGGTLSTAYMFSQALCVPSSSPSSAEPNTGSSSSSSSSSSRNNG